MPLRWASCLFRPARGTATCLEINPNACPPELHEQLSLRGTACLRPRGSHILYERIDDAGQGAFTPPVLIYIRRLSVCGGLDVCVKRTLITHFVSRAAREARLQVQLQHPHLLPALASVRGRHHYYLVLPAAEGDLWSEVEAMRQQGTGYTEGELQEITRQILMGLEQLHSSNLAHRDIKPANVLRMPDGRVTVADFGCADGCTLGFVAAGTAQFQPPECRRNAGAQLAVLPKGYDQRMQDMWSVGATLASLWFAQLPEVIRGSGSSRVPGAAAVAAATAAAAAMRNESTNDSCTTSATAMVVPAAAAQLSGTAGVTIASALSPPPPLPPFLAAAGFAACTSTVGVRGEPMSEQLLDLLARLLRLRPSERLTVTQALRHSWLLPEEEVAPAMVELQPAAVAAAELSPSPVSSPASPTDRVRTIVGDRFGPFLSHPRMALLPSSTSSPPVAMLQPPNNTATEATGQDAARIERTEQLWEHHLERQQLQEQNQQQDSRQSSSTTPATATTTAVSSSETATPQSHSRKQMYSKGHSDSPSVFGHCHSHDGSSPSSQTMRSPGEEAQLFALRQRQQQQQQSSSWLVWPSIQAQNPKRAQRAILRVFVGAGGESSGSN